MINYIVIGICILLLVAVIYVSAKPINMGIEARRNLKNNIVKFIGDPQKRIEEDYLRIIRFIRFF